VHDTIKAPVGVIIVARGRATLLCNVVQETRFTTQLLYESFSIVWRIKHTVSTTINEAKARVEGHGGPDPVTKVVRMWAHTITKGHAIQSSPGVWNEEILRGMDFILAQARKRGLKIIWALADNWYPVGGIEQGLVHSPGCPPLPWSFAHVPNSASATLGGTQTVLTPCPG